MIEVLDKTTQSMLRDLAPRVADMLVYDSCHMDRHGLDEHQVWFRAQELGQPLDTNQLKALCEVLTDRARPLLRVCHVCERRATYWAEHLCRRCDR